MLQVWTLGMSYGPGIRVDLRFAHPLIPRRARSPLSKGCSLSSEVTHCGTLDYVRLGFPQLLTPTAASQLSTVPSRCPEPSDASPRRRKSKAEDESSYQTSENLSILLVQNSISDLVLDFMGLSPPSIKDLEGKTSQNTLKFIL